MDFAHDRYRVGRHVKEGGVGAHALDQSVCPERHQLDIRRHRERGKDHLSLFGDLLWRIGPDGPLRQKRFGRGPAQIVHDQIVPGLLQIGGHALAHHPEPDEILRAFSPPSIACRHGMSFAERRVRAQG